MEVTRVRAVLFAKDLNRVAEFYCRALGMVRGAGDESHSVLRHRGFELIVHQIPKHIADGIEIAQPPLRRDGGSLRLDYPVESLEESRRRARSLGGDIELDPPEWADRDVNFYLGHDPEGNRFGVSQQATSDASH
jgi:predicted enzyme related to lactoylglutathione lyase